jgi:hypothetical protein
MAYPYLIQGSNIVVVIGNKSHTISKTNITYNKVLEAIKTGDWDSIPDIIEPKKVVLNYGQGNVSIQGETLFWKGKELNTGLSVRMIQMLQEGFPIEPMVNFMENLYKNPSKRAVTELYGFLEKSNLPITPDGHFLAYKKVRANYFDVHSGTMDNSVGQVVEMERHDVDDNKDNTCSSGLHFCSMSYLTSFGGERTVIVKINPADVVSIPSDYNDAKGRTCRYEVIGELDVEPEQAFTRPVQTSAVSSKPVHTEPKLGNSAFYAGYSAGFQGSYNATDDFYGKDRLNYREGFEKGTDDRLYGGNERYRYTSATVQSGAWKSGAWPFPNKG